MLALEGRRVLVTGGSRGIGAACCRELAAAGAVVAVHYRVQRERADEIVETLPGEEHFSCAADLQLEDDVSRLFAEVDRRWGRLDALVNNAGIWVRNPIAEFDPELFDRTIRVNLRSFFLCTAKAIPLLESSRHATIVNMASTAGQRGEAYYSPYAASKGAVIAATRSWASELAPRIRVNAVAPGWVDTEMCVEPFADGGREVIADDIPLGAVATAEDLAGPVVFLVSGLSRFLTGSVLSVNGGAVMAC